MRNVTIILVIAAIVAAPFVLREPTQQSRWQSGDPVLVIISPHNEAIKYEFERGFSIWHEKHHQKPVRIEWRNIGGTTEIARYLGGEYAASARAYWRNRNLAWPSGMTDALVSDRKPGDPAQLEIYDQFRSIDDPARITVGIDLFFGGGWFDHDAAFKQGYTVPPAEPMPRHWFADGDGQPMVPDVISGEIWLAPTLFGNAVSTFGICYNLDRLKDLGIDTPPQSWMDLTDGRYVGTLGMADPTKSGSIAKAFEMIIHQQMSLRLNKAGYDDAAIAAAEKKIAAAKGKVPAELSAYQAELEAGWLDGLRLVQRIAANARYFTDSASKVPIDVSVGDASAGMAIDFYGRFQAQIARSPQGQERMIYVTPRGGSSVSADPISLLRGAPSRELAVRFIEYVMSEEGQKLWTYRPGTPGGPERYALRRLPVRREFYPSTQPAISAKHEVHRQYAADDVADPRVDPYRLAEEFVYYSRWTGGHFSIQRDLVRAMCLDSGEELRGAWRAILRAGGPEKVPQAAARLAEFPVIRLTRRSTGSATSPVVDEIRITWASAPSVRRAYDSMDYNREWTNAFRAIYADARQLANEGK